MKDDAIARLSDQVMALTPVSNDAIYDELAALYETAIPFHKLKSKLPRQ